MKKEIDMNEVDECVSEIIDICTMCDFGDSINQSDIVLQKLEDQVVKYDDELKKVVLEKLLEEMKDDDGWHLSDVKTLKRIFTQFKNGEKK